MFINSLYFVAIFLPQKKLINLLFHLKFFTRFTNVLDKISFKMMQNKRCYEKTKIKN